MAKLLGITGTPGTGKKTLAPMIATKLGLQCISLNDLAASSGALASGSTESEVDVAILRKKLPRMLPEPLLIYGHLLPYALGRGSIRKVVVLRCEPSALKRRLVERGYSHEKVRENVEAELIGLISSDSLKVFGKSNTSEFNTTSSEPRRAAASIAGMFRKSAKPKPIKDWTLSYDTASKLDSLLERGLGRNQPEPRR